MRCKICQAGEEAAVNALLQEQTPLRKIADVTEFSVQNIRTHQSHAKIEKQVSNTTFVTQLNRQYNRLERIRYRVQKEKPDDFDLLLKIESELAKVTRQIAAVSEKQLLADTIEEKGQLNAQISSLSADILRVLDNYPDAQTAMSELLAGHRG